MRATEAIKEVLCERRKMNIQHSMDVAKIPEYVFESLARSLLPEIQKYYESEDVKRHLPNGKQERIFGQCIYIKKPGGFP